MWCGQEWANVEQCLFHQLQKAAPFKDQAIRVHLSRVTPEIFKSVKACMLQWKCVHIEPDRRSIRAMFLDKGKPSLVFHEDTQVIVKPQPPKAKVLQRLKTDDLNVPCLVQLHQVQYVDRKDPPSCQFETLHEACAEEEASLLLHRIETEIRVYDYMKVILYEQRKGRSLERCLAAHPDCGIQCVWQGQGRWSRSIERAPSKEAVSRWHSQRLSDLVSAVLLCLKEEMHSQDLSIVGFMDPPPKRLTCWKELYTIPSSSTKPAALTRPSTLPSKKSTTVVSALSEPSDSDLLALLEDFESRKRQRIEEKVPVCGDATMG